MGLVVSSAWAMSATTADAWSASCVSPTANKFLGNAFYTSGLKGVYSEIEYIDKSLCVQGATRSDSWSLSWVSLDGPQDSGTPGVDIFQGGYAKCPPPSVGNCPYSYGLTYIWVFYGHEQGACGLASNTGFVKIANATSGMHFFQISKVGTNYNFYYDESLKYSRPQADVDTCWPGINNAEWQNEMLNNGDQGGGPLSNHQAFANNQYQTSVWHDFNRTLGASCDANSYPAHWTCVSSSLDPNWFTSWDDRAP